MAERQQNLNIEIFLEDVRLSYPHLFTPTVFKRKGKADPEAKPRFTASFLLDKKKHKKLIEEIEDAIEDVKEDKWGKKPPRLDWKNVCLSDGDDSDKDEQQGCMVLKAAAPKKSPPAVLGRDKRPLREEDGIPYGGCYVNAIVRIYAYDEWSDQVLASLEAVQYFRKGESFGKGKADTSKFGEFDDEDDEEFSDMRSDRGSRRGRDRDEDDDRGSRSRRGRDEDEDEDRGSRRGSSRRDRDEEDEDRGSRRGRDDDRGSRNRGRDDDRGSRSRGRGRDDDDDIPF